MASDWARQSRDGENSGVALGEKESKIKEAEAQLGTH